MVYQLADVNITSEFFVVTVSNLSLFRKPAVCRRVHIHHFGDSLPHHREFDTISHTLYLYPKYALRVMSGPSMDHCGNAAWSLTRVQELILDTNAV